MLEFSLEPGKFVSFNSLNLISFDSYEYSSEQKCHPGLYEAVIKFVNQNYPEVKKKEHD